MTSNFILSSLKSKSRFWNSFTHLWSTFVISEVHFFNLSVLWNYIIFFWMSRCIFKIYFCDFDVHLSICEISYHLLKYFLCWNLIYEVQIVFSDITYPPFLKYTCISHFQYFISRFLIFLLFYEIRFMNLRKVWNLIHLLWISTSYFEVHLSYYEVHFFILKNR